MGKKMQLEIEQVENGFKLVTGGAFRKREVVAETVEALLRQVERVIRNTVTKW